MELPKIYLEITHLSLITMNPKQQKYIQAALKLLSKASEEVRKQTDFLTMDDQYLFLLKKRKSKPNVSLGSLGPVTDIE